MYSQVTDPFYTSQLNTDISASTRTNKLPFSYKVSRSIAYTVGNKKSTKYSRIKKLEITYGK